MAWYSTGTAAITQGSATIEGAGTNWINQQPGWAMVIDGVPGLVEIAAVVSSTELRAAQPISAPTASGLKYAILPTQGLTQKLVEDINKMIDKFQGVADGPGAGKFSGDVVQQGDEDTGVSWPEGNAIALKAADVLQLILKDGAASGAAVQTDAADVTSPQRLVTVAGARAAASSNYGNYYTTTSNVNIDTVSAGFVGLVHTANPGTWPITPSGQFVHIDTQKIYAGEAVLQRAVYGYGQTEPGEPVVFERIRANTGGAWSDWVRQSPERGSNANGDYVLHADGTLECWNFGLAEYTGSALVLQETWNYPYAFIQRPTISLTPMHASDGAAPAGANWNGGAVINCHSRTTSNTTLTAYVSRSGSWASGDAVAMHMVAKGRAF